MKKTLLRKATIVNEGQSFVGSLLIVGDVIDTVWQGNEPTGVYADDIVDVEGCFILPGIIDDHVHFREPGLTHKADITTESRAAAAGGVTSYFDMPNTSPQTTTIEDWEEKQKLGAEKSLVNYAFFFGATNGNSSLLPQLDKRRVCGVKLFMGASTGNMLVDQKNVLHQIFLTSPLLIMTHCEDTAEIIKNTAYYKSLYGDDPDIIYHPLIRSQEACYRSSQLAVNLAKETGARLHIAHLSTARELELLECSSNNRITAEACISHLYFNDKDYKSLGTRIKCNPAIKTKADQIALQKALTDGRIHVIGTDHAPHSISEKKGGCVKAVSGMPMIQFSLVTMLELVDKGVLSIERLVQLMCHNPATLFEIKNRGFIRRGYKADLVIIRPNNPWTVTSEIVESKCKWSPLEGHMFNWSVQKTFCNGHLIFDKKRSFIDTSYRGEALIFDR